MAERNEARESAPRIQSTSRCMVGWSGHSSGVAGMLILMSESPSQPSAFPRRSGSGFCVAEPRLDWMTPVALEDSSATAGSSHSGQFLGHLVQALRRRDARDGKSLSGAEGRRLRVGRDFTVDKSTGRLSRPSASVWGLPFRCSWIPHQETSARRYQTTGFPESILVRCQRASSWNATSAPGSGTTRTTSLGSNG